LGERCSRKDIGGVYGVMHGKEGWGCWQWGSSPTAYDLLAVSLAEGLTTHDVAIPNWYMRVNFDKSIKLRIVKD
jgi:hypothetical protein